MQEVVIDDSQSWRHVDEAVVGDVYARDLAKTLERYTSRVASVLKTHMDAQLSEFEKEKVELSEHRQNAGYQQKKTEESLWGGYEDFKMAAEEQRNKLKFLRIKELDQRLLWHTELLDAERSSWSETTARFERETQDLNKYLSSIFESGLDRDLMSSPTKDEKITKTRSLEHEQRKNAAEKENYFNQMVHEVEVRVAKEFQQVVEDSRSEFLTSQQRALLQVEEQLRVAHEAGAVVLEEHAKLGETFGKKAQKRWRVRHSRSRSAMQDLTEAYKAVLQRAYQEQIKEMKQHIEEQTQFYKTEIKKVQDSWQVERTSLTAQLRKMCIALTKWRHDYAADAKQKAVEAARQAAERALQQHHDPAEESKSAQATSRENVLSQDGSGMSSLNQRRETLQRIWRDLGTSDNEIKAFYRKLERAVPFTNENLDAYDSHLSKHGSNLQAHPEVVSAGAPFGPCQRINFQLDYASKQRGSRGSLTGTAQ